MASIGQSKIGKSARDPYSVLLNRILVGEYAPGASLVEQEIAKELGVSRTPVREALLRLKLEGMVKIIPRGGIFVSEASVQLIREVTEVRLVLEEYLAFLVTQRRSDRWLQDYEAWLRELEPTWHGLSPQEWMQKDGEFHRWMDQAAQNEVLTSHLRLLRRQAVLFWGQTSDGLASLEGILRDFEASLEAVAARDLGRCVEIFRNHVLDHVERIQSYLRPGAHWKTGQ